MKINDKGSIKMEQGAGGEGMRELLKLMLSRNSSYRRQDSPVGDKEDLGGNL